MISLLGRRSSFAVATFVGVAAFAVPAAPAAAALPEVSGDIVLIEHHFEDVGGDKVLVVNFRDATPSGTVDGRAPYALAVANDESPYALAGDYVATMDAEGRGQLRVVDHMSSVVEIREFADGASAAIDRSAPFALDYSQPEAPMWMTVSNTNAWFDSLHVAWGVARDYEGVVTYKVYVDGVERLSVGKSTSEVIIGGLDPSTEYAITVLGVDAAGNLGRPASGTGRTAAWRDLTAPSAVSGLTVTAVRGTSVDVQWVPATDDTGVTDHIVVASGPVGSPAMVRVGQSTRATLSNLTPGAPYWISVRAVDAAGNEGPTASVTATTVKEVPPCLGRTPAQWQAAGWIPLVGSAFNDTFYGSGRREVFFGLSGDDTILGRGGNDVICAGPGRDAVFAGAGADRIVAVDQTNDLIDGGRGKDSAWVDQVDSLASISRTHRS